MEDYCTKEGLDFKLLIPLIQETALSVTKLSPSKAQTGPAVRNDSSTIEKHLQLLKKYPDLEQIYKLFTESISQAH
jgi:hypothetical protein